MAPRLGLLHQDYRIVSFVKLSLGELRRLIRESLAGSHPSEAYDKDLADDPSLNKRSVYVPNDVKKPIKRWLKAMGLSKGKKKRPCSA